MRDLLIVGVGGFFGSISRHALTEWVDTAFSSLIPSGTLVVNAVGSGLAGAFAAWFKESPFGHDLIKHLLVVGFLGGFTTFSTFSGETVLLFQEKAAPLAILNIVSHIVICLSATFLGFTCVIGMNP